MTIKQVIVARKDLNMSPGKLSAQVAHAAVKAQKRANILDVYIWDNNGHTKIVLEVGSQEELEEYFNKCTAEGFLKPVKIIDAGRTELEPNTFTCFGVGPAKDKRLNPIFKGLKLYK